jgi:hypothetical protein
MECLLVMAAADILHPLSCQVDATHERGLPIYTFGNKVRR